MTTDTLHPLVARLTREFGFPYLDAGGEAALPAGDSLLFLPAHGKGHLETPDLAVVLPELVQALGGPSSGMGGAVASPAYEKQLREQLGGIALPAIVVMRDGRPLGSLSRMRDWDEFLERLSAVIARADAPASVPTSH
ncbi:hydrogenase [Bosea sp. 117]|uniref:hydrogenase n=1 Tax=Bosea sp. 117 TaxID=1125973 RepID=UPI000494A44A|nr:hydrogenase [Bosea sp. 117]